ncbi:hypothetical protein CT0861_01691 [Colletotrichum tofieldiae]|uniref:Uncharacterized protein n=1 Tax=Colletotrichum tofieldiae TaxID=708197 RepID=A0A166R775_9PEZI|nr:hypothetical protein CT0861_01691 [Colletotrichum tofieldiae]
MVPQDGLIPETRMAYSDTSSPFDGTPSPMPSIEVDPPSSPEASSSLSKASSKQKLSKKAHGKQPATHQADKDDIPNSPGVQEILATNLPRATEAKQLARQRKAYEDYEDRSRAPMKYDPLLRRFEIGFENTKKTTYSKIIELLRSRDQFDTRVNDLEVYVGSIEGNDDEKSKPSRSQSSRNPQGQGQNNYQTRPSLTQRQNSYEDEQDRLGEQQDVIASQQQRLDRRLVDIEYCLHLNAPTRAESAPPRPTAPTAGLFPPWSEGYWGGSKSPSRLAGAWGQRGSRSSRGAEVMPSIEDGSDEVSIGVVGGGVRRLLWPPVTGRTAVSGPTSTVPTKRKSGEFNDGDINDDKEAGKRKKQKNHNGDEGEEIGGDNPELRLKVKVKPAGTIRPAPKEPKVPLKINKRKIASGGDGPEDGNDHDKPTLKTARVSKSATKTAPRTGCKERAGKSEDDGESDDHDDDHDLKQGKAKSKPQAAGATEPAPRKPEVAPSTASKMALKTAPKADSKPKPSTAPKRCKPKNDKGGNEEDSEDSDHEAKQEKPKPGAKPASTTTRSVPKAARKTASKTVPETASKKRPRAAPKRRRGDDDDDDGQEPEKKKAKVAAKKRKPTPKTAPRKAKAATKPATKGSRSGLRSQGAPAPAPAPPPPPPSAAPALAPAPIPAPAPAPVPMPVPTLSPPADVSDDGSYDSDNTVHYI